MRRTSRRQFLTAAVAATAGAVTRPVRAAQTAPRMTLGFSTYGMKSLPVEQALTAIHQAGFRAVEIAVRADWDSAPAGMPPERRKAVRDILAGTGLRLRSLMEHLFPAEDPAAHKESLERLRQVFQLAVDLAGDGLPPLVQTVLGDGEWDKKKALYVDRVGEWSRLSQSMGVVLCVKPHRGGAMSRPAEAIWLIQELDRTPWLRMVYDYSHYAFREIPLVESLLAALPLTAQVVVKDAVQDNGKVRFVLPGEAGTIDYDTLLKTLYEKGYTGDVNCEVSGMVSSQPGYDPLAAVKTCFTNMSAAFRKAGVPLG